METQMAAVDSGSVARKPREEPGEQLELIEVRQKTAPIRHVAVRDIILSGRAPVVESLVSSIRRLGLLNPPILVQTTDGKYLIVAGRRRIAAVRALEIETIDARVYEEGHLEGMGIPGVLLTENANRSDNPIEEMRAIRDLLDAGLKEPGIAKSLGKSRAWVKGRLSLTHLDNDLQEALAEGRMSLAAAVQAAKLSPTEQALLTERASTGKTEKGRVSLDAVEEVLAVKTAPLPLRMFEGDEKVRVGEFEKLEKIERELTDLRAYVNRCVDEERRKGFDRACWHLARLIEFLKKQDTEKE